jgi:hypothetical protein
MKILAQNLLPTSFTTTRIQVLAKYVLTIYQLLFELFDPLQTPHLLLSLVFSFPSPFVCFLSHVGALSMAFFYMIFKY